MANYKILLIDDDPDFKQLLEFDLRKQGYEVVMAGDGEEGLAKARSEKPNVILADIKMPKMDGYTFVRHAKKDPNLSAIPIIVLTSYEPMKDMFQMEGINDYFVKSVDTDKLFETIKKHLSV